MAGELAGRCKLAQLVANHVLGNVHGHMLAAVMDGEGVTDELGEDGGGAAPGLHDALLASLVQSLNLLVQGRQNVRALLKLVNSAAANAENNFNMDRNNLYVAECYVCPGPTLKRIMPRAQGRAYRILKRTSHMTVVLKEKE